MNKGIDRRAICLDGEGEQQYLQDISEVLLYLLLPSEDFQNKTVRFFLREIIATSVLLPTVNMLCNPDYVNQTISWLVTIILFIYFYLFFISNFYISSFSHFLTIQKIFPFSVLKKQPSLRNPF